MGLLQRLSRLDDRVGIPRLPGPGQSRRDYLAHVARLRISWPYRDRYVYDELVELHDRVTALEARLAAIEGNSLS